MMIAPPKPMRTYAPTHDLLVGATALTDELRKVTYPKRGWVERLHEDPPGRLVASQLIQRRAQIAKSGQPTAKPFRHRTREKVQLTSISAGLMFDASGSQGNVQEAVGAAIWLMAEALDRVHGRVAAVRFGANAHPILAPGEKLNEVEVYNADDAWENFVDGFSLVDGALDLIDGEGARLLFIVTDGYFNDARAVEYAEVVMDMCRLSGVAVVWLDAGNGFARPDAYGHGEIVSVAGMNPVKVAELIGETIVEEFRKVAPQHG